MGQYTWHDVMGQSQFVILSQGLEANANNKKDINTNLLNDVMV